MITGGVEVVSTRRDQEIKYVNGLMGADGRESLRDGSRWERGISSFPPLYYPAAIY